MAALNSSSVTDLLGRARGGDPRALDRLFELCRNYLAIVARSQVEGWLRAKVDASDIVQQTLLEAHRDFGHFRGASEAEWLTWLRRILTHNTADFIRQYRGTEKRQEGREVALRRPGDSSSVAGCREPADPGETPSEVLVRKERELQVADAMSRLTPDHREVIMLRNLQRLPFDEVARQMGRSRPAVQMLWMRAIQKLQELLDSSLRDEA
jgi:RNA polymerase sigma-70 factor (ECF subfamily)